MRGLGLAAADAVDHRRDQPRLVAQRAEQIVQQRRGRGLAVGARDAHDLQLAARIVVEGGRQIGHRGVRVGHLDVRYRRREHLGQPLANHGRRTPPDGCGDEVVAVALRARHGEKQSPRSTRRESYVSLAISRSAGPTIRRTAVRPNESLFISISYFLFTNHALRYTEPVRIPNYGSSEPRGPQPPAEDAREPLQVRQPSAGDEPRMHQKTGCKNSLSFRYLSVSKGTEKHWQGEKPRGRSLAEPKRAAARVYQ